MNSPEELAALAVELHRLPADGGVGSRPTAQPTDPPGHVDTEGDEGQQIHDEELHEQAAAGAVELHRLPVHRGVLSHPTADFAHPPGHVDPEGDDGQQVDDEQLYEELPTGARKLESTAIAPFSRLREVTGLCPKRPAMGSPGFQQQNARFASHSSYTLRLYRPSAGALHCLEMVRVRVLPDDVTIEIPDGTALFAELRGRGVCRSPARAEARASAACAASRSSKGEGSSRPRDQRRAQASGQPDLAGEGAIVLSDPAGRSHHRGDSPA